MLDIIVRLMTSVENAISASILYVVIRYHRMFQHGTISHFIANKLINIVTAPSRLVGTLRYRLTSKSWRLAKINYATAYIKDMSYSKLRADAQQETVEITKDLDYSSADIQDIMDTLENL